MNIGENKVIAIGEIVQMLHNASLLLDDIEDNSILRRGIPVAHKIFGKFLYFLSGNSCPFPLQSGLQGEGGKRRAGDGGQVRTTCSWTKIKL